MPVCVDHGSPHFTDWNMEMIEASNNSIDLDALPVGGHLSVNTSIGTVTIVKTNHDVRADMQRYEFRDGELVELDANGEPVSGLCQHYFILVGVPTPTLEVRLPRALTVGEMLPFGDDVRIYSRYHSL